MKKTIISFFCLALLALGCEKTPEESRGDPGDGTRTEQQDDSGAEKTGENPSGENPSGEDPSEGTGGGSTFVVDRNLLYGEWTVENAKFAEDAIMMPWDMMPTGCEFKENGMFVFGGYFGADSGSYSVKDNLVTVTVGGEKLFEFDVTAQTDSTLAFCATSAKSGARVWLECCRPKAVTPPSVISDDIIFGNESLAEAALLGAFAKLGDFVAMQNKLESLILNGDRSELSAQSSLVSDAWSAAWNGVRYANSIVENLSSADCSYDARPYVAQARLIRSFLHYNLAVLWGDVPIISFVPDVAAPEQSRQPVADVMAFVISDVKEALNNGLSDSGHEWVFFSRYAADCLLAEAYLTLDGDPQVDSWADIASDGMVFSILMGGPGSAIGSGLGAGESCPVYTPEKAICLVEEGKARACGDLPGNAVFAAELAERWASFAGAPYGYWAALKRLGMAQSVTGCQDFELLMPIPRREIDLTFWKQNPGW